MLDDWVEMGAKEGITVKASDMVAERKQDAAIAAEGRNFIVY